MTPAEYKQHIISELQRIKDEEFRQHRNAYAREYYKRPYVKKRRQEYNKEYWQEYRQRPEVKERATKRAHDKWIKHRQKVHNDEFKEKLKPNYLVDSYCSRCERVRPKGYRCPKCNYMMKNGPTRKKEVFRY